MDDLHDKLKIEGNIMNNLEANKKIAMKFFELSTNGQIDDARALLHDEVEWWVLSDLPTSGTHSGPDGVMNLFETMGKVLAPPIKINFTQLTAEEDRVAVEMNIDCMFVNGTPYYNVYHQLFTLKDGKIFRVKGYFDTKHVAEVFPI
jgi:uncharacterized protein